MFRPTRKRKAGEPSRLATHTIRAVRRGVLDHLLAAGASSLPNEFGGALRSDEPGIITEVLLVPGGTSGKRHANFHLYMLPADLSIVGSAHSHPSGALHPSDADLGLFRHWGRIHLILGAPFRSHCWRAYDNLGEPVKLEVLA